MVGAPARLTLGVALALFVGTAGAQSAAWSVEGNCRDGQPHGLYELRSDNGALRVAGAFNHGRRTGSFIFWSARGTRIAHIPYDDDRRNGTVATWYDDGATNGDAARELESAWRNGVREGLTRSWKRDGHRRSETDYSSGAIVSARGWNDAGTRLADRAAREVAGRDALAADARLGALEELVREHLPRCD
jgi:hypothetical protein